MKQSLLGAFALGAALGGGQAMADDSQKFLPSNLLQAEPSNPDGSKSAAPLFIDKAVFLLLDGSGSMDQVETKAMLDGIFAGLETDEAKAYLNSGNVYQFIVVTYGNNATLHSPITVNNYDDAVQLLKSHFIDPQTGQYLPLLEGKSTNLGSAGLRTIQEYLNTHDAFIYNIAVVAYGDDSPSDGRFARTVIEQLYYRYSVHITFHCAVVDYNQEALAFYEDFRSARRTIRDEYGAQITVPEAVCPVGKTGEDLKSAIPAALIASLG